MIQLGKAEINFFAQEKKYSHGYFNNHICDVFSIYHSSSSHMIQ